MKKGGKNKNNKQNNKGQQNQVSNSQSSLNPAASQFFSQAKTEEEKLALLELLQKKLQEKAQQKKMEQEQLNKHEHGAQCNHGPQTNPQISHEQLHMGQQNNSMNFPEYQEPTDAYRPEHNQFLQDEEEFKHFRQVVCSYFNYRTDSLKEVARMERGYHNIGANKQYLKYDFNQRLEKLKQAIELNAQFLDRIVESYHDIAFLKDPQTKVEYIPQEYVQFRDISKLRSTLKQMIRDWSEEGQPERDLCYKPVLEEFKKHYPNHIGADGKRVRVLFPGCGLGRVVFDFACLGYGAQGNEFSYHMLFASNFILNMMNHAKEYTISPFIHSFCNTFQENDPFREYKIPDVNPSDCLNPEMNDDFSMAAGEFVEIYKKQPEEWHGVCTVFFIDTANDIVEYIKTIHKCLKPGGVWINLGPLLYHYAESFTEPSIELSWDEVQHIIKEVGFELTIHPQIKTHYATDPNETMMKIEYNCIFFTAIKK
ncbi:hypothetical protein ABPG74_002935 [Tetrahymena malaccensis]